MSPVSCIVPKIIKGRPFWISWTSILLQNRKKIDGGHCEDIKFAKKVSRSRNKMQKKFLVKGDTRTQVLLLDSLQKFLINLYAKCQ